MYLDIQRRIQQRFVNVIREAYGLEVTPPPLNDPPSGDLGDLSLASCFELAKQLRRSPKKIAEELAMRIPPLAGIERVSVAGAGYLNFHLDRAAAAAQLFALRTAPPVPGAAGSGKIVVEHTSINPNKAAHIGHLRNAVLGDTFARLLRASGEEVEVQNYIDNTGVQVADVVVGFVHLEKKTLSDVEKLIQDSAVRFDYSCWDLYARVFQFYEEKPEALSLRSQALKDIEEGHGDLAALADLISTAIVRLHLATMLRINVEYDLLVQESEILRLDFWKSAFELLKSTGAIRYEDSGKNQGCWVMTLREAEEGKTEEAAGGETSRSSCARMEPSPTSAKTSRITYGSSRSWGRISVTSSSTLIRAVIRSGARRSRANPLPRPAAARTPPMPSSTRASPIFKTW